MYEKACTFTKLKDFQKTWNIFQKTYGNPAFTKNANFLNIKELLKV